MTRPEPTLHSLLCILAIIAGVLFWAGTLHVDSLHVAVGILLAALGLLLLL